MYTSDSRGIPNRLHVDRSQPFNKLVTFKAGARNSNIQSIVIGAFIVCGKEKLMLKDSANKVFNIRGSKTGLPTQTFELKDVWAIDTTGLL